MAGRVLLLADVYPALSMPQADAGNLRVLEQRAAARGIAVRSVTVQPGDPLPAADLYQVAGAEDEDLPELARRLAAEGTLAAAVAGGAVLLAIDAGFQVVGRNFADAEGREHDGLGLLDARSSRGAFVDGGVVGTLTFAAGLPELAGFESHCGRTLVGEDAVPFARLEVGTGNGGEPATDGAVAGRVIGTYVHGPLLAWNPALADHLLGMLVGMPLAPLPDEPGFADEVRDRRIAEARQALADRRR
jgi:lipid II isoglutaminyl synthase (glutamine-hydrolysing)